MNSRATVTVLVALSWSLSSTLGCGGSGTNVSGNDGGPDHAAPTRDGGDGGRSHKDSGGSDGGVDGTSPDGGSDGSSPDGGGGGDAGDGGDATDSAPMPTEWVIVSTPLDGGVGLYGVGGYTTLDVWAVGGTTTAPADIFWGGASWVSLGLVSAGGPLLAVSSQGADDSWSIAGFTVYHWDGTGWHTLAMDMNTTPLASIWASAPGQAIAAGNTGTILSCDSSTTVCTATTAGGNDLTAVNGLDSSHAWAAGKSGTVYAYDGTSWTVQTSGTTKDLYAVSASDAVDVWAVGDALTHGTGGATWTVSSFTPPGTLHGVYAASPTAAWAVGKGGIIVAWDGTKWKNTTSPTTEDLFAVWGANQHDIWAVGAGNTVLRRTK